MARPSGPFRMEAAGSLTPELEGASRSGRHPRRGGDAQAKKKGEKTHERH
ncbi:hypothetical protein AAEU42_05170 [Pseudoflavonifractor phocaeensis]